jgi:hypothetical protein
MATARGKRGFTLPLTLALAFSLMALATAIVGMVLVSDKQAKAAASEMVTRASLESGVEAALFDLEQNGEPQSAEWTGRQVIGGREVTLIVADARFKPDVDFGAPDEVRGVIADAALRDRALAALAPPSPDAARPFYEHFADFVGATGAGPAEEDCLRRRLTIGRRGASDPAPPPTAFAPPREPLDIGEVIDVRAETRDWEGRLEVFWRRARFTGRPQRPWLTHDWRQLRLGRDEPACPLVEVAPTISNAAHTLP